MPRYFFQIFGKSVQKRDFFQKGFVVTLHHLIPNFIRAVLCEPKNSTVHGKYGGTV